MNRSKGIGISTCCFATLGVFAIAFSGAGASWRADQQFTPSPDYAPPELLAHGYTGEDWRQILAAYQLRRHSAFAQPGAPDASSFRMRNPGQRWLSLFNGRGVQVQPDHGRWTWGLEFDVPAGQRARVHAQGNRLSYHWSEAVEEWFVNDQRGLEHGFTVHAPPPGSNDAIELRMRVRGELTARAAGPTELAFADEAGATELLYRGLKAWDATGKPLRATLEIPEPGLIGIRVDTTGARYPVTIDPLVQQAYLKASNTDANDWFGFSVSVSGETVVVGAILEASAAAGVNGNQADNGLPASGAAYVFVRNGGSWSQQAYLKASNPDRDDFFGFDVDASGDTIVVGAPYESSAAQGVDGDQTNNDAPRSGAAYVFVRNDGVWVQQAYLKASNTDNAIQSGERFGHSVAVSGQTIVVGAPIEGSGSTGVNGDQSDNSARASGAAYVYVRSAGTWLMQAYLKASNTELGDSFGEVAIDGDTIAVGAWFESSNARTVNGNQTDNSAISAGAVYVFVRSGAVWSQQAYLKASNADPGDRFGIDVAVAQDTILVGADGEAGEPTGVNGNQANNNFTDAGAAYVFVRNTGVWSQQAYLKAPNAEADDRFGLSVAASGDRAAVGAFSERGGGTGLDADPADHSAFMAGAAYLYRRTAGAWEAQSYVKASNTGVDDSFGYRVAISGDTLLATAHREASNATGVNGNQADNSADSAGAAYAFLVQDASSLGAFNDGLWLLDRNGDFIFDSATEVVEWGSLNDIPVHGDWNGDGFRNLGSFSGGTWFLDRNGDANFDPATEIFGWGASGWTPVTGDWNGDGITDLGVVDPSTSTWFVDLNGDFLFDPATEIRGWGSPGDTPIVGDWDGDGDDDLGVFSDGTWFIDFDGNGQFDPATDQRGWGAPGWTPVVGDWDGDGADELAAVSPQSVWFRDLNGDFVYDPATETLGWGSPRDEPVVVDWNGDGVDDVGVFSGGTWFIDLNGNGQFDPAQEIYGWGVSGWTPVPGPWN